MGSETQGEGGSWLGGDSRPVVPVSPVEEGKSLLGMRQEMWTGELKE